jgi:3-oxoacyl-[acyl-carrier-protein] synthase-1
VVNKSAFICAICGRIKSNSKIIYLAVYIVSDNIYSPLGSSTTENFAQLLAGHSGIKLHHKKEIHPEPFYASLFDDLVPTEEFTRFELMLVRSITDALSNADIDITDPSTGIIISTTKGNISLIEHKHFDEERVPLHESAKKIAAHFKNPNEPVLVSNACISGLTALITGKRLLDASIYKNVVVAGADTISSFVFSGFNAFMAISAAPCKPYDADRSGVTLGEAAATIILSTKAKNGAIQLKSGAGSNDANHISGPSRTGLELSFAIKKAIEQAGLQSDDIDFISAHGTATLYNDEMEAKAIHLSQLEQKTVNSLKGYYGHTLGAAGIIESVISMESLRKGTIIPTKGFESHGVSLPLRVTSQAIEASLTHCLKTASGFGGCNAAVVFSR